MLFFCGFTMRVYLVVQGQEGRYSVYVHASEKQSNQSFWKTSVFQGRDVQAEKVSEQLFFYILCEVDRKKMIWCLLFEQNLTMIYMDHLRFIVATNPRVKS
jgi:hypothetical protein